MNRTLGFFLGSAVVFALLVIVVGQPITLAPPTDRNFQSQPPTKVTKTVQLPEVAAQTIATVDEPIMQTPAQSSQSTATPTARLAKESEPAAAADTLSTPPVIAPPVAQVGDENSLTELWMSSVPTLPVDSTADISADIPANIDEQALPIDGSETLAPIAAADAVDWFPVWDPFHSELSANAFARRLERITGLDYRVIKTDTNQYRVAMAYSSEDQRMINVAMIEEATGLSVSGGSR